MVSDIAECAEVVEAQGITFPKGDVNALQKTLQRLCDDPAEVKTYQEKAADFICGKYDWDHVTEKTLELYHENTDDQ